MKKLLFFILISSLCITSCSTLFDDTRTNVLVYSKDKAKVVYKKDTLYTQSFENYHALGFEVPLGSGDLNLKVFTDSVPHGKLITIPSKLSFSYFGYYGATSLDGNLRVVDKITNKQKNNIVPVQKIRDRESVKNDPYVRKKGDIYANLFFPHVNYFKLSPDYEDDKDYFGFMGIGLGVDYYYHKNRFLNISVSGTTEFMVPFPAPVCMEGEYTRAFSLDAILTNNHRINRISLGYGLSYARNIWRYNNDDIEVAYSRYNSALGLAFKGQFYFSEKFTVGLIYRPTFVRLNSLSNKTMKYEHLLSLDFGFKFRLNKRK